MTVRSAMFMEVDASAVLEDPCSTCVPSNTSCIFEDPCAAFSPMVPETGQADSKKQLPKDTSHSNSGPSGHEGSSCPAEPGEVHDTRGEAGASGGLAYEEDPNEVFSFNSDYIRHSLSSDSSQDSLPIDPGKHVVFMIGKRNYFVINEDHVQVGKRRVTLLPARNCPEEGSGAATAKVVCGDRYTQTRRGRWIELDDSIYNNTGECAAGMRHQKTAVAPQRTYGGRASSGTPSVSPNRTTDGPGATGPIGAFAAEGVRGQPAITAFQHPTSASNSLVYPGQVPYYAWDDDSPITVVHSLPRGFVAGPQLSPTRTRPGFDTPPRATSSPCLARPQCRGHRAGPNGHHATAPNRFSSGQDLDGCSSCRMVPQASASRHQRGANSSSSSNSETDIRGAIGGPIGYTPLRSPQTNDAIRPTQYYRGESEDKYMDMSGVAPADYRNDDVRTTHPAPPPGLPPPPHPAPPPGLPPSPHPAQSSRHQKLPPHILQEARQMACYQKHMSIKPRERSLLFRNVEEEYSRNDGSYFMWRSDDEHLVVSTMYNGSLRHMRLFFSHNELWVEDSNLHAYSVKDLLATCTGVALPLTVNIGNAPSVNETSNAPPLPARPRGSFCGLTEAIKFLPPIKRTVSQGAPPRPPAPSPVDTRSTAIQRTTPPPNGINTANISNSPRGSPHTLERQMAFG